jgi:hypothetical protein
MSRGNGFMSILLIASLAVFIITASAIVGIGCGELLATRVRNDLLVSAYYVAISGAERMYAFLKTRDTVAWDPTMTGNVSVGGNTIGAYSVRATKLDEDEFCIVSVGTVNNHSATATVQYGYLASFQGPVPIASMGAMSLTGASQPAKLIIEGPAMSNGAVTTNGVVTISNGSVNMAGLPAADFWLPNYGVDTNGDNAVSLQEAQGQGAETEFRVADANADDVVTEKEAFVYYYTSFLNDPANNRLSSTLNIGQGQPYRYSGDQVFNKGDIPKTVPIIFVDGNVTINYNDQDWTGSGTLNHTIVASGTINITQPTNRPGDKLALFAFGDISNTGSMGNKGSTIGDIVIYTHGNYTATHGGKANASIYAEGTCTVNTIGSEQGKDHRVIDLLTVEWDAESDKPLGLPPGYPANISFGFNVKNQSTYAPVWQRD